METDEIKKLFALKIKGKLFFFSKYLDATIYEQQWNIEIFYII